MKISSLFAARYKGSAELSAASPEKASSSACGKTGNGKNIFHFLKKDLRSTAEITEFLKKLSDEEKYVGSLPEGWRNKFKPEQLKEKTLEAEKIFSGFAASVYSYPTIHLEKFKPQMQNLSGRLQNFLGEECEVSPVDSGDFGKVFRIKTKDEDLALKVYHYNPNDGCEEIHGQTKEVANAIYLSNTLKPNQTSKFYCAKVTAPGDTDAFMLTEFVKPGKKDEQPVDDEWRYHRYVLFDKLNGNVINGKIIDYGSVFHAFDNKRQKEVIQKLFPLMKNGDVKGITEMREQNRNDEDFMKISGEIVSDMQKQVNAKNFVLRLSRHEFTFNEIQAYRALGVNFDGLKKYLDENAAPGFKRAVIAYGLDKDEASESEGI